MGLVPANLDEVPLFIGPEKALDNHVGLWRPLEIGLDDKLLDL